MRVEGLECPWCGATRFSADHSAYFSCGSWDQISSQDGVSPRYRSDECKALEDPFGDE